MQFGPGSGLDRCRLAASGQHDLHRDLDPSRNGCAREDLQGEVHRAGAHAGRIVQRHHGDPFLQADPVHLVDVAAGMRGYWASEAQEVLHRAYALQPAVAPDAIRWMERLGHDPPHRLDAAILSPVGVADVLDLDTGEVSEDSQCRLLSTQGRACPLQTRQHPDAPAAAQMLCHPERADAADPVIGGRHERNERASVVRSPVDRDDRQAGSREFTETIAQTHVIHGGDRDQKQVDSLVCQFVDLRELALGVVARVRDEHLRDLVLRDL